jgi:hypothetical protein
MRTNHLAAALLVPLSFALLTASCIQSPTATPENEPSEAHGSESPEPLGEAQQEDDPQRLYICLALAPASISKKVAFCDSLPSPDMQARCMSHRWNRIEWVGWCYFEFTD